jgi:hypothetical protein
VFASCINLEDNSFPLREARSREVIVGLYVKAIFILEEIVFAILYLRIFTNAVWLRIIKTMAATTQITDTVTETELKAKLESRNGFIIARTTPYHRK